MSPRKVVITGITGYVGSFLEDSFRNTNDNLVWGITRQHNLGPRYHGIDLLNKEAVEVFMDSVKPDVIFHLATNSSGRASMDDAFENIQATHNITRAMPDDCKLVFASSSMVYTSSYGLRHESDFPLPDSFYGVGKAACEQLVLAAGGTIARLVGVVGPFMTHGVLLHIINKLQSKEEVVKLKNKYPGSHLQFIHITDVVRALRFLGDNQTAYNLYNVATCNLPISLHEITVMAKDILGIEKDVVWEDDEPLRSCKIANDALLAEFKLEYHSSELAIRKAVESYVR